MDINQIRKLIKLLDQTDITEIEVSEGEHTVRISKQGAATPQYTSVQMPAPVAQQPAFAPAAPASAAPAEAPAENSEHTVVSPMVGTFYRAASPDSAPFVNEGDKVKKGDTLCIIEAMKLMNEIEAEYDGIVEKIMPENATPIEYGQSMFIIRPL